MSATGEQRTELTNTPTGNSDPTWSPDGTHLALVSTRNHGIPDIYIMRSDGTDVRQITDDTASESELAWSPRGDRIAFVRVPAGGGDRDIYSVRTDGTGLTDLTNDPHNADLEPAYSPAGTLIAFSGPLHPGRDSVGADLWIMNADGTGTRVLEHEDNGYSDGAYPAWSPDGATIAFAANNGSGYYHIWSVPAGGGQNAELVTNRVAGGNPLDEELSWQPAPTGATPTVEITAAKLNRRRHSLTVVFAATGPATSYRCALSAGNHRLRYKPCQSGTTYSHLRRGRYTFEVIASGPGETYRHAAVRRFTIR